jgi:hypothetical protein
MMQNATERGMRSDAHKMDVETAGNNFAHFFNKSVDGHKALPKGLTLDLSVKGPQSKDELKELGAVAHDHCPAAEVCDKSFQTSSTPNQRRLKRSIATWTSTRIFWNEMALNIFDQVQLQALETSPSFMTWIHRIAVRINVKKKQ